MTRWMVTMIAMRLTNGRASAEGALFRAEGAKSEAEALGAGYLEARTRWPLADRWTHNVQVVELGAFLSTSERNEIALIREAHEDHERDRDGCLSTAHLHRGRLLEILGAQS